MLRNQNCGKDISHDFNGNNLLNLGYSFQICLFLIIYGQLDLFLIIYVFKLFMVN